jgi:hypothetical protein
MNSVSGCSSPADPTLNGYAYGVSVAKKQLEDTKVQGEQAVQLIEAAAATPLAPHGSVGHLVDLKA